VDKGRKEGRKEERKLKAGREQKEGDEGEYPVTCSY